MELCGKDFEYSSALGMLGVTSCCTFNQPQTVCAAKASKALVGVSLLANAQGGMRPKFVLQLVKAVVLLRLLWCAVAWYKQGLVVSKLLEQVQQAVA